MLADHMTDSINYLLFSGQSTLEFRSSRA